MARSCPCSSADELLLMGPSTWFIAHMESSAVSQRCECAGVVKRKRKAERHFACADGSGLRVIDKFRVSRRWIPAIFPPAPCATTHVNWAASGVWGSYSSNYRSPTSASAHKRCAGRADLHTMARLSRDIICADKLINLVRPSKVDNEGFWAVSMGRAPIWLGQSSHTE